MNNKQKDLVRHATKKIRCDEKCKPNCYSIIGPTGPTGPAGPAGGPTGATGTSQIIGMAIVTTTSVNSILTVQNPADNATALTITPSAGGTQPVSAHLLITQIQ